MQRAPINLDDIFSLSIGGTGSEEQFANRMGILSSGELVPLDDLRANVEFINSFGNNNIRWFMHGDDNIVPRTYRWKSRVAVGYWQTLSHARQISENYIADLEMDKLLGRVDLVIARVDSRKATVYALYEFEEDAVFQLMSTPAKTPAVYYQTFTYCTPINEIKI